MIAKGEMLRSLVSNLPRRESRCLENLYMDIVGLRAKGKMEWGIYSNKFRRRSTLICYDSGCSLKDLMRVELFKRRTLTFKYRGLKWSRSSGVFFCLFVCFFFVRTFYTLNTFPRFLLNVLTTVEWLKLGRKLRVWKNFLGRNISALKARLYCSFIQP